MTNDEGRVIDLLKSWESGYIAPSAQMVIKEARIMLEERIREVNKLRGELYDLRESNAGGSGGGAADDNRSAGAKGAGKLRRPKSPR